MPYSLQAHPSLIEVTIQDEVTLDMLLQYWREFAELEASSDVCRNVLTEFRGIQGWHLDSAEMRHFAALRTRMTLKNHVKSAIVATRDVDFGMARMFELALQNPAIEVRVFRDMLSARQWLYEIVVAEG